MTGIASLPMYDWPEIAYATDQWWAGLRRHLVAEKFADAPERLERGFDRDRHWRSPDLLLSQTCGYPLTHAFEGALEVVGVPVYAARGCEEGTYRSVIVVAAESRYGRPSDLKGGRAAFNARDSLSGHLALRAVFAPLASEGRFFGSGVETGSHLASMEAVASGGADVAAIDCVTFALARAHRPKVAGKLRAIGESPQAPALPYVTAAGRPKPEVARLKRALAAAAADPNLSGAREALLLKGFQFASLAAYGRVLELEAAADALGYMEL